MDVTLGLDVVWAAQDLGGFGYAVSYPLTVPPVPEATVSVVLSNGVAVVSWTGRALEQSPDLATWTALSNAPQPCVLAPTNAPHFFRALK
jgi:hypothetical protein